MAYTYPVTVHVEVTPVAAGWTVGLLWASPLNPENWQIVPGSEKQTDATGTMTHSFEYTTTEEYGQIWCKARAPAQLHPVTGEMYSEAETSPRLLTGYTESTYNLDLIPFGSTVLIVLQGTATAGVPLPDMTLEILVDDAMFASKVFTSVEIDVIQELSAVYDLAGSHNAQGKMYISNALGTVERSTSVIPFDIPSD